MRAVVQRIKNGTVSVDNVRVGAISHGLLVYLAVGQNDEEKDVRYLVDKIAHLRIFPDDEGKMNCSLKEAAGELLVISQFTLFADARKGRRPSYSSAAQADKAEKLYQRFIAECKNQKLSVSAGMFGAMMDVSYTNYGPVTILLDSDKLF